MTYFPVIAHMVQKLNQQKEGKIDRPILEGFTDEELNTVRAFVCSFDYSTFERFPS